MARYRARKRDAQRHQEVTNIRHSEVTHERHSEVTNTVTLDHSVASVDSFGGSNGSKRPKVLRTDAVEVLKFLNLHAERSFRMVDTNLRLIEARLASGATIQNCKGVVARKVREWKTDPKMSKFLRPETLFSASHFESYLGEREPDGEGHGT